jgi:hypothetical protein
MILLLFYVWYEAKFLNEFGIWSVPYWVPVVGGKIVFVICTVFGFDLGSCFVTGRNWPLAFLSEQFCASIDLR